MKNLIERYVYDVTRRLAASERADVEQELTANIYDMLPENASEKEIEQAVHSLGSPMRMAQKYQEKPQYLISPAVYSDYKQTLKLVMSLVIGVLVVVGALYGVFGAITENPVEVNALVARAIQNSLSFAISGGLQAAFWVTVVFAIIDRKGPKAAKKDGEWSLSDLPTAVPDKKGAIPLADSIVELVALFVFLIFSSLLLWERLPVFISKEMTLNIVQFFAPSFIAQFVPIIIFLCFMETGVCIAKIIIRRWTPLICGLVVADTLISIGATLFLLTRKTVFSPEVLALDATAEWSGRFFKVFGQGLTGFSSVVFTLICVIVIVAYIAECATAVYKTIKANEVV